MTEKRRLVCCECGSDQVKVNADAVWNEDKQEFELGTLYEEAWYAGCGREAHTLCTLFKVTPCNLGMVML